MQGCDVSHPAPGVGNRPSIASVVTSYNDTATRYNAYLDCQSPRQEVIEHLADMVLVGETDTSSIFSNTQLNRPDYVITIMPMTCYLIPSSSIAMEFPKENTES